MIEQDFERAAGAIADADAILIGAGAGMGVDSGLPDFRGNHGFWRAYPPYERLGLDFVSLANPRWFSEDPTLAWGFYGHRMELYRRTTPHAGFAILRALGRTGSAGGGFVFTSNVDGHFERAGFARSRSPRFMAASTGCNALATAGWGSFRGSTFEVEIDPETMRAVPRLPECPECGALARPNILMFGDFDWNSSRTDAQMRRTEGLAGRTRECEAGCHRMRGRAGDSDGANDLRGHRPEIRGHVDPHQYAGAGGSARPHFAAAGGTGGPRSD